MGDIGARMLAKALQVNTSLHTLYIDQNGITAQGFTDIARALERSVSGKHVLVFCCCCWCVNGVTSLFLNLAGFMLLVISISFRNFTLKSIPLPLSDVTMALKTNQPAVEIALKKVGTLNLFWWP